MKKAFLFSVLFSVFSVGSQVFAHQGELKFGLTPLEKKVWDAKKTVLVCRDIGNEQGSNIDPRRVSAAINETILTLDGEVTVTPHATGTSDFGTVYNICVILSQK